MRAGTVIQVKFAFGHHVLNPHYHDSARIKVELSAPVCEDPASPDYLMAGDAFVVRDALMDGVGKHLAGRMIVWEKEVSEYEAASLDADKGIVPTANLELTLWKARPTIEAVTFRIAEIAMQAVRADDAARITRLELWETDRTACCLVGDEVREAAAASARMREARNA